MLLRNSFKFDPEICNLDRFPCSLVEITMRVSMHMMRTLTQLKVSVYQMLVTEMYYMGVELESEGRNEGLCRWPLKVSGKLNPLPR